MAIESEKPEIDYIRYLKNNLLDTYKYGDGFTIFKELIQNASDASSDSLKVYVLDSLKNAQCAEALKTRAIIVYDDGHFDKKNKNGILKIASDNKTSESTKIGRYGLGMKSIFHICDFFIYAANTNDFPYERVYPVNYWPDDDERFKNFSENDIELVLNSLPPEIDIRKQKGFILYIPLKITKPEWSNIITDPISPYPFGSLESLKKRIPISLALLSEVAPQKKKLKLISYSQDGKSITVSIDNNDKIKKINTVYNSEQNEIQFITYKPTISDEVLNKIRHLKESDYWTKEQKDHLMPEVCFELLRNTKEKKDQKAQLNINFCVYLPLEEEYCSQSFEIDSKYDYTILIHSNFAVDSGRRGIRGFSSLQDEATELGIDSEEGIQKLWNKYLAQMIIFPEIPCFLNEVKELIPEHNDYCEISNKLCEACFTQSGKNINLYNHFTTQNYGFANIYGIGWASIQLEKEKSNYILLPYSKDENDIQAIFPLVKEKKQHFILKTPNQKLLLPMRYHPDEEYLIDTIKSIPTSALTEEKYITAFTYFIDFHKSIISGTTELHKELINHIKSLLIHLSFDDLAKNQTRLSELFSKINEATGNSSHKVYSVGQKDKSDLQRLYSLEDFKNFWKKESSFVFIPGFIQVKNEELVQIQEKVFDGDDTICDFIKIEEHCKPHLHRNILSSILTNSFEKYLKDIATKYPTLYIFKVTEAYSNKQRTLNYRLLQKLISQKQIFMTQSNPSNKETVFFYFVKTIYPIQIYHISKNDRSSAGLNDNEIQNSDEPTHIWDSFSSLYYDSKRNITENDYEINLDVTNEYWYQLLDEGFKHTFQINKEEKDFYRFLFSGFDKELKTEPLISFDDDVPDVWKEVYKNIEPDARMIPHKIPARAKEQIKINQKLLNINCFDKNDCRDKLRIYEKNGGNLDFFKSEYFQDPKKQKFLFEIFNNNEENLYKAIPLHVSAEMGNLIDAKGKAYLNPDEITFPEECCIRIKLIKISDDVDLQDIQNRFISSLTIKDAIVEALSSKKENTDISNWIFKMMRACGNRFKDIFETAQERNYFHWIPLKTDKCKSFCDIQDILNDTIFSADSRAWISQHYEMFNISDLDITASDIELLQNKKLLAETYEEQLEYLGRKVDKVLSFHLNYGESKSFFSDCILLKDFKNEPIFGLLNILKQERANNPHQVFEFYTQRKVLNQTAAGGKVFEELLNFISNTHEVTLQSLSLYEKILHLLLQKDEFDISSIKYPTQNNQWKPANEVSLSNSSSIAPEYLLHQNIYKLLSEHNQIKGNDYSNITDNLSDEIELTDSSAQELIRKTFVEWEKNLEKKNLLYLFFYLLKDTFKNIATQELNEKKLLPLTNDLIYHRIDNSGSNRHFWSAGYTKEQAIMDINPTRGHFRVRVHIPKGKITRVRSLAGSLMRIEMVEGSELYTDTPWYSKSTNQFHVYLINTTSRVIDLDNKLENLISLIWKQGYKQRSEAEFKKMLRNFKESNQNTIKTAQLFMFENLILHLKDLNLNNPFFKEIFKEYTNLLDEKTRKENTEEEFHKYIEKKNILSQKLIDYITSEKVEADYLIEDIFNCVIRKINQAQYDQSRILFELLQNADDSVNDLVLHGEDIKGRTKFIVVDSCNKSIGKQAIHVSHFGRLINESLDRTKEDKFANDLLNMLLINSSDKDGESTGRFGLGFKSVYFICQEPILRSGDLQFKIRGALYPENVQSDSLSSHETRIELTLNNKAELDTIYGEFEKNADLQALFCKHINEISIRGKRFKPELQKEINYGTGLYYSGNKKYLKFRLQSGTIVFKVSQPENNVESFGESSVARIWNLTPLATAKTFPFAINSSFEVDIGRKNLDETNEINKSKFQDLSKEFTSVLGDIFDASNGFFSRFLPSILNQLVNGCTTKDSVLLNNFCKHVLIDIYNSKKIIPDGIGGIKTNPIKSYFIAPTNFKFEYNTQTFNDFIKKIGTVISRDHIVTRNVKEALRDTPIEFHEIENTEIILRLLSDKGNINDDNARKFMEIISLISDELPTTFNWERFRVQDSDGVWNDIRTVLMTPSFSEEYSEEVRTFFKNHITFESSQRKHSEKKAKPAETDEIQIIFPRCTVLDIYNKWKSLTEEEWATQKENYYKKIFPDIMQNKIQRKKELNITPDYFDSYDTSCPTMPISWCILFMLGNLQSQNYWGESKAEVARKKKIESLMELITLFCEGNTLDSLYNQYLETHQTDEDNLIEFENLLRVYKFRCKFMEIWAQFYGITYEKEVELNMILNASTAAQAAGKSLHTYASQKSLKYGISMIIRELMDNDFFDSNEQAFETLNKFTYMPHAYLRRIVFDDWTITPADRTSEEIHDKIKETLQAAGIRENQITKFMKCHDLPFLILGEKK